jgi:hypothetical protein
LDFGFLRLVMNRSSLSSFRPQGFDWVYEAGAARGNQAGEERDDGEGN